MSSLIDEAGNRYGRYTVWGRGGDYISPGGERAARWWVVCDCGVARQVRANILRGGHSKSCGCLNREVARANKTTHGKHGTPEYSLWHRASHRAKESGLQFDLSVWDIVIPATCPVLGIPLVPGGAGGRDASPSLDRIVPERGYVRGNVCVISQRANRLKSDAAVGEIAALLSYVQARLP